MLIIMDDSLVSLPQTYQGLKPGGVILINSTKQLKELDIPDDAGLVAEVDASGISEDIFGKNLPNTAVLGAFARIVDLVDKEILFREINNAFGEKNVMAAERAYDQVKILRGGL